MRLDDGNSASVFLSTQTCQQIASTSES